MPPRRYSRYQYCVAALDANGRLILSDPDPFPFVALTDNVVHPVVTGDTLWGLAHLYFQPLARPSGLWWIIADFQPTPIVDPTIALEAGQTIYVPSVRTVLEQIFSASRQQTGT
jgi:hypothetical protein